MPLARSLRRAARSVRPRLTAMRSMMVTVGALALVAITALPASAHVSMTSDTSAAGSYAELTLSVPHGCDGSPTTAISIQIPDGINAITPTRSPYYTVEKVLEKLEPPVTDSHGNQVTERVVEVVYTSIDPLPEGYRDTFALVTQIPQDMADQVLYFPVVQTCEAGESAWIEIPADGQTEDDLDLPAPSLAVTAAIEGDGHGAAASAGATADHDSKAEESGGSSEVLSIAAIVLGGLGLLVGTTALLRGRPATK